MNQQMEFPDTFEEFAEQYGFIDREEIYTNASWLIPVHRVTQWLEHINKPTQMIDKSNFRQEQYKADTDTAYQCGYEADKSDNSVLEDIKKMIAEINGEICCAEYHEVECNHETEKQEGRKVIEKIVHKYCDKHISGKEEHD